MTDAPLIRINIDPPKKIAELYSIGLARAKRIVLYREKTGFFQTPEDLSRVEGIGLDLATTLAPHINWELPLPPKQQKKREWFNALIGLFLFFFITQFFTKIILPNLTISLEEYSNGVPAAWTNVWADISKLVILGCMILVVTFLILMGLTASPSRETKYFRFMVISAGFLILSSASALLARIFKYLFYNPVGWTSYISESSHLISFLALPIILILFTPIFLAMFWPKLRANSLLARTFDFFWIISAPFLAIVIWVDRGFFQISYLFFIGICGIYFGYIGIEILRTGESYFTLLVQDVTNPKILQQNITTTRNWQSWINSRLPDPEQQKALKKALDETYPPSKLRTWSGAIVLGAGGWIVLTVLSTIVQWIVEKGLTKLWP